VVRKECVAAKTAAKSMAATSHSCYELIENNNIKVSTLNVKPIRIYKNKMKHLKKALLCDVSA
jgi:hypothetical protein